MLFEGDLKDPALLQRMDRYGRELEQNTRPRGQGRFAGQRAPENEPGDERSRKRGVRYQIPESRDAVAQYLELYAMSGDPSDFEKLVDFDYTRG